MEVLEGIEVVEMSEIMLSGSYRFRHLNVIRAGRSVRELVWLANSAYVAHIERRIDGTWELIQLLEASSDDAKEVYQVLAIGSFVLPKSFRVRMESAGSSSKSTIGDGTMYKFDLPVNTIGDASQRESLLVSTEFRDNVEIPVTAILEESGGIRSKLGVQYAVGDTFPETIELEGLHVPSGEKRLRTTRFKRLAIATFDTRSCFLRHYGLPEPRLQSRSGWYAKLGIVGCVVFSLIAFGFWRKLRM